MTLYSYKISKIDIHNIHNEKKIEIEYLRLIFYRINILKNSFTWYPREYCRGIPGRIRPVRTQNTDSLHYTIFLHACYAMKFCLFL